LREELANFEESWNGIRQGKVA